MMAKPWSEHRGTITELYIHQGRTLEDVRNIMKVQHNFEASIRSYRQHFDKWEIGKYNCKKRERRRRQSLSNNPLSPPHSPPDVAIKREDMGSPTSSSSSMSRRSSEQKPLPILKQPPILYPTYLQQIRPQEDLPAKAENSRGSFAGGLDMFRNSQVTQDMFSSAMPLQHYTDSAGWQLPRGAQSSYIGSSPAPFYRSPFQDTVPRCMPEPLLYPRSGGLRSGLLRAPDLSMGKDNGGPGSMMHPLIGYQSVAQG